MGAIIKFLLWIPTAFAGILGVVQGVVKVLKELVTLIVDVLFPLIPSAKFKTIVRKIRDFINVADVWIEKLKEAVLGDDRSG